MGEAVVATYVGQSGGSFGGGDDLVGHPPERDEFNEVRDKMNEVLGRPEASGVSSKEQDKVETQLPNRRDGLPGDLRVSVRTVFCKFN